jgi:hypothetical protein
LPAVTRLWAWYNNVPREGKLFLEIERLHSIYGKQRLCQPCVYITSGSVCRQIDIVACSFVHLKSPASSPCHTNQHVGTAQCKLSPVYSRSAMHTASLTEPNDLHADATMQDQSSASHRMRCISATQHTMTSFMA